MIPLLSGKEINWRLYDSVQVRERGSKMIPNHRFIIPMWWAVQDSNPGQGVRSAPFYPLN